MCTSEQNVGSQLTKPRTCPEGSKSEDGTCMPFALHVPVYYMCYMCSGERQPSERRNGLEKVAAGSQAAAMYLLRVRKSPRDRAKCPGYAHSHHAQPH